MKLTLEINRQPSAAVRRLKTYQLVTSRRPSGRFNPLVSLALACVIAIIWALPFAARGDETVVANHGGQSLYIVDLTTGNRTVLSSATNGTGTLFTTPVGLARDSSGNIYVGEDGLRGHIFKIDPRTGNRTVISSSVAPTVGTGGFLAQIYGLAIDANGNIIAADTGSAAIYRIDPSTGNRTVLASSTIGTGAAFSSSFAVIVNPDASIVWVTDAALQPLISLNPATLVRTVVSSSSGTLVGTGAAFNSPTGLIRLSDGSYLVVNFSGANYLLRVDPTTGNRTVVSGASVGSGSTLGSRYSDAVDTAGNYYIADYSSNAIVKVDPLTGNRTTVSKSGTIGSGPAFNGPIGMLGQAVASITNVNVAPTFVGSVTTLVVSQGASATDITGLLHVSDTDSGQTETWNQSSAPLHGTLSFSSATASSGSTDITPGGTITYTPTAGYSGSDSFDAQVSDGRATATRTISVTVTVPAPVINSSLTASGAYGGAISSYTITASGSPIGYGATGLPAGLSVNMSSGVISGTPTASGTFSVTISATNGGGTGTATLGFTIAQANLTVTGVAASNKTYDATKTATLITGSAALSGVIPGDMVTLSTASAVGTFSNQAVGAGKTVTVSGLSISGSSSGNYTLTQPTTTANITVLTVAGAITAANKTYDGTTAAVIATRTLTGVIGGDSVSLVGGTAAFSDQNAGVGKPVTSTALSLSGSDAGNYALGSTTLTTMANITQAPASVTLGNLTPFYDGTVKRATATTAPTGLTVNFTYNIGSTAPSLTGAYAVTGTINDLNYQGSASGTLYIIPAITSAVGPAAGYYQAGQALLLTLTYSGAVTVDTGGGIPSISLTVGGVGRTGNYVSGSGTGSLVFGYEVQAGDTAQSGISSTSPIALNGGTIQDAFGNNASLTFTPPDSAGVVLDTTAPPISIGSPSASYASTGPVTYTVTYADANFNASTLAAGDITLNKTGTANGTLSVVAAD